MQVAAELEECSVRAGRLAGPLSPDKLSTRPQPGSWSVAECLDHLSLTTEAYLPRLDEALADVRNQGLTGSGPFRMEWTARLLRFMLEPPARLRTRTSAPFVPSGTTPEQALPRFLALQKTLLTKLHDAAGLALDRVKIRSPFAERVRYNLYSAFVLIAVHERRHLWQAEKAIESLRAGR